MGLLFQSKKTAVSIIKWTIRVGSTVSIKQMNHIGSYGNITWEFREINVRFRRFSLFICITREFDGWFLAANVLVCDPACCFPMYHLGKQLNFFIWNGVIYRREVRLKSRLCGASLLPSVISRARNRASIVGFDFSSSCRLQAVLIFWDSPRIVAKRSASKGL